MEILYEQGISIPLKPNFKLLLLAAHVILNSEPSCIEIFKTTLSENELKDKKFSVLFETSMLLK